MITVAECMTVDEAQVLKSMLAASGITATLPDEFTTQNLGPLTLTGGVRVQVEDEDAETALTLIASSGADNG